jgi:stage II sporulation protein M
MAVLLRGFNIGFTLGIIIQSLGNEATYVVLSILIFKEILLLIVIISTAANGVIFSRDIIRSFTTKNIKFENIKLKFANYCFFGAKQLILILIPILIESVFLPVFIKI